MKQLFCSVIICAVVARAQFGRGGAEWMTDGADAQRSHWIPADAQISPDRLREFQFLWKVKLNSQSVQLNSLTDRPAFRRWIDHPRLDNAELVRVDLDRRR